MFYIVETKDQLQRLEDLGRVGVYLDLLFSNENYHPKLTSLVAVYIRPFFSEKGYIVPINHQEGLNVPIETIYKLLLSFDKVYTLDKKLLLYYFDLDKAIDIYLLYSMTYFKKLEITCRVSTYSWFYNRYEDYPEIGQLIPLTKLYEKCEETFLSIKDILDLPLPPGFSFYNDTLTPIFFHIEKEGIGIHEESFIETFKLQTPNRSIDNGIVYTHYNLYNNTSRPTNSFNSINFAAIPKSLEYRNCFKPKNDYFVEFDFDAYHIRLLGNQINYNFSSDSAHRQLAKLIFNKENITEEEYSEAKQLNFQAIYGKIPESCKNLEFFRKTQEFIDRMWDTFTKFGEIAVPITGKTFTTALQDMNPPKLMNYVIQNTETSRNTVILKNLLDYLRDKETKVALYQYDAIILDFSKKDGKETLLNVDKILTEGGEYPIRFRYSSTFHF